MIEATQAPPIEALKAGDREAFAQLVDATSSRIYRVALKILGNAQDAEDALQETYLKAYRALGEFEGRSSLITWLYRIAVNEALMMIRKRKVLSISLNEEEEGEEGDREEMEIVDWCCLPESDLLSSEARKFLNWAVELLPIGQRVVFVMRDMEGLSIQETAEALNISEGVVKIRLLRARLRLRQELTVYYGGKIGEEVSR